jgi:hypothetical protein
LGGDVARSLILFADGKPLGSEGLRRLKIHLINLTDLMKKASIDERAKFADDMLAEIFDSADQPLTVRLLTISLPHERCILLGTTMVGNIRRTLANVGLLYGDRTCDTFG